MTMSILRPAACALGFIGMLNAPAFANDRNSSPPKTVNILAWPTSFSPAVIGEFTKQTGIEVVYDNPPSDEFTETKIMVGKSGYDVVNATAHPFVANMVQADALLPLNRTTIPNLSLQDEKLLNYFEKQEEREAVGLYYWGTTGFGLTTEARKLLPPEADLTSLSLFFDPKYAEILARCGFTILDSPTDVMPMALMYLGINPETAEDEDLEKVIELFDGIRPLLKKFDTGGYKSAMAQGDQCAAIGYAQAFYLSDVALKQSGRTGSVDYVVPKEGGVLWMSGLVIPKDAPNRENAERFLNYALSAEVGASYTNSVMTASAVPASREFIDTKILSNPMVYPDSKAKLYYHRGDLSLSQMKKMNRAWARIKTGV
ncbi:putrescine transport system substrate-binding protein [Ochrobactrum anthropi]|uniref:extracellular solute-binding protein n=1 Tax=Brucella anthropi TaxID=529 RepID=UPI0015F8A5E0|nr:extracellular solute-binding protein [Brucella anthropi]MBA8862738.1 putrescine transport system substrate-binding protein [Brucella anthropi]